jgi:hypothetical protein
MTSSTPIKLKLRVNQSTCLDEMERDNNLISDLISGGPEEKEEKA